MFFKELKMVLDKNALLKYRVRMCFLILFFKNKKIYYYAIKKYNI